MYVAGYATEKEIAELERRGWEVENAEAYSLVDESERFLMTIPGTRAVVVFVDNDLFSVMSGPGWDKNEPEAPFVDRLYDLLLPFLQDLANKSVVHEEVLKKFDALFPDKKFPVDDIPPIQAKFETLAAAVTWMKSAWERKRSRVCSHTDRDGLDVRTKTGGGKLWCNYCRSAT